MPRSPRKKNKSVSKESQQQQQQQPAPPPQPAVDVQDDEEENSADSVEQAAREAAIKDEMFDQDSLMFEEVDDIELPADDEPYQVSGRGADIPGTSPEILFDETDSTVTTPYGSPMSAISTFSSIQKWTGEVKKMLLDDQRQNENRTKGWVFPLSEVLPSLSSAGRSEGFADVEGSFPESDFDVMPTTEELAERYSNELIEKEKSILQKDAKILELERSCRDIKNNLDDCQKELKLKTETATAGVEKLKQTLEEKDKSIMETSEKLRKVTESYNSSEKRWKEQQEYLEKQIQKLKSELESNSNMGSELERLTEESRQEKRALEQQLEKAKEDSILLKKQFAQEKESLEEELQSLRDEKVQLEEQLQEEIRNLEDKLMLAEQECETALNENESIRKELESQEQKNRTLTLDIDQLKESKEEIVLQLHTEKQSMEELIKSLKQENEKLQDTSTNEKYEFELQLQTLNEQLEMQKQDQTAEEMATYFKQEKETLREQFTNEKYELELQVQTLREELAQAQRQAAEEVQITASAPVNFFTQEPSSASQNDWLEKEKSLEDRIAELELEKGNLLLQLVDVDVDEQQVSEQIVASRVEENQSQAHSMLQGEVEATKRALEESEQRMEALERELEESKLRDRERIESAMNTIAWEEKMEILQKENATLSEELQTLRKSADELSCRYEEMETKCTELEMGRAAIEGVIEIDKSDGGWSDDIPQIPEAPDEGFTEDPKIKELEEALEEKEREIRAMNEQQRKLEEEVSERSKVVSRYETLLEQVGAEKSTFSDKLDECRMELEKVQKELQEKVAEEEQVKVLKMTAVTATDDGWGDDEAPVMVDDGQLSELKEELSKKSEELTTTSEKCRGLEDKLKKAMKAIKQKNDKIAEYKNRLGEDPMSTSVMETRALTPVQEPLVTKSVAYQCGNEEFEKMKQECEEKGSKIVELEGVVRQWQEYYQSQAPVLPVASASFEEPVDLQQQEMTALIAQKDSEIANLQNELSQVVSTLNSKNEEIDQLMRACGEMEKSVDEKVELLNECVARKDEEVRQAIIQYEDFLKDATLNVSQLTKELEEKIREINALQGQVLEGQEALLETQNEFESYKRDSMNMQGNLFARDQELENRRIVEEQLRQELYRLQSHINELTSGQSLVNEALDRAEAEKNQLREESVCLQNEYGSKNRELQVQISQLIDQLNEKESSISVMEARLKESDELMEKMVQDVRSQLDQKTKSLEQVEQTLFVKNEELVRLEERVRDGDERTRSEMEQKLKEMEDQHKTALESYAVQNSEDLERTCDQLGKKNSEVIELQESNRQLQERIAYVEQEYSKKCMEITEKEQALSEVDSLRGNIQHLEATVASYVEAFNNSSGELIQRNEEVKNLQNICSQYEEKLYNSTMSQDEVQRTMQESQQALAQCQQDATNYYTEAQNCKVELEGLKTKCNDYEGDVGRLNSEVNEAKTLVVEYATEMENLKNQLRRQQEIEGSLNKYLEDLNSATDELGKKNSEMRELEKVCSTQETQLHSLQATVEAVKKEVEAKDNKIAKLEGEVREMSAMKADSNSKEMEELRAEVEERVREIGDLRYELEEGIEQEKIMKKNTEEKDREIYSLRAEVNNRDREMMEIRQQFEEQLANLPTMSKEDEPFAQRLQYSEEEKQMLERKIDLLQNKLMEVEGSEVKCYEDFSRLKILRTELEMDNLRMSAELEQLRRSLQDGDNDPKYKSMENQIFLMTKTLEDRDKLCRDLMKNISELQQAHDALQVRVNDLQVQNIPTQYYEGSLEAALLDLDRQIFSLKIDIDRERKIRELYEGLLFLAATAKKQFESGANRSTSSGWFGLGDLFSSPSSSPSRPRAPLSTPPPRGSLAQQLSPHYSPPGLPFTSTPSRPLTPVRPITPASLRLRKIGKELFNPLEHGLDLGTLNNSSSSESSAESDYYERKKAKAREDYDKGLQCVRKKEMHEAKDLLESAVINSPHADAEMLVACGEVNEELNQIEVAHHYYSVALRCEPENRTALSSFSRTLRVIQNNDKKQLELFSDSWEKLYAARPSILTDLLADKEFQLSIIQGSAAVEGNSISIHESREIIDKDKTCRATLTEHFEIVGLRNALKYVHELLPRKRLQSKTLDEIKRIHAYVMLNDPDKGGAFRNRDVVVGNHNPPKSHHVYEAMHLFMEWLNGEKDENLHPVHFAAAAHFYFVQIHPFQDGNGRTARILMNWLLLEADFPPVIISSSNDENYQNVLGQCIEEGNPTSFIRFILNQITENLKLQSSQSQLMPSYNPTAPVPQLSLFKENQQDDYPTSPTRNNSGPVNSA